jgi:PAS domain S-box-containing protein
MDSRLRILIIDDDEVDRMMAQRALKAAEVGEHFAEASDAKTGIAMLADEAFDVALLDHALPDMDGLTALRAIRGAGITTPVILLTGQGDERLAVEMMRAGANDYLSKTRLSRDLLSHSVRNAVRLHRAQAEATLAQGLTAETEQRFRTMADSAPVLLWVTDDKGAGVYNNQGWLDYTGRSREQELGDGWAEGVHPDDRPAVTRLWLDCFSRRARFHSEFRLRKADGSYGWVLQSGAPRFLPDGTFAGYIGSGVDISEMKRAEQERVELLERERAARSAAELARAGAQASEAHYRFLAESIPAIVWTTLADGRVDYVNRKWVDYTGLSAEQSLGWGWMAAVHPDDLTAHRERWERACHDGTPMDSEVRYRRSSDGTYRWHLVRAMPLRNKLDQVVKWFGTGTEIEEQKRTSDALTFMADASAVLASSLNYEETLGSVARLAVPKIADWCFVDVVGPDGVLRRVAVAHREPAKVAQARDLAQRFPIAPDNPVGSAHVLRTAQSELYERFTDAVIERGTHHPEHAEVTRSWALRSLMVVPMIARGRVLGAITFATAETERWYGPADLALGEDLARRVAAAVDNARLYREAQAAFQAQDQAVALLDTLLEKAPIGLAFFDTNLRYVRINETLAQINGLRAADHIGRTTAELLPDLGARVTEQRQQVLLTGEAMLNVEMTAGTRASPANDRRFLVSHYPVRSSTGEMLGIGSVVVEITSIRRAEEHLQRAKAEAEQAREVAESQKRAAEAANHAKDQFLAVLSHELRTPLSPVLSTVQAMENDPSLPEGVRESIDMIRRNVELEARLIDDLLDLTRISKGKLELHLQTVDAHETLTTALDICRSDILDKGLRLEARLDAAHFHVRADSARLHQVYWNLIKNAVKFTPEGGTIYVTTRNEEPGDRSQESGVRGQAGEGNGDLLTPDPRPLTPDSWLVVEVRDTGIGIEPHVLPRIFDAFEQGERSITRKFGGLGLGLAISKALIDMQGGHLGADSAGPGQGAAFSVRMDAVPAPAARDGKGSPVQGGAARSDIRILLVDDHLDTALAMRKLLERLGYRISIANTLAEAIASYQSDPVDLVISDIGLPDGSGLELIRQLKAMRPVAGIALSGFGMEDDVRKSKEAGFYEHLTKPVNFQRLHAVIREATTTP